VPDMDTRNLHHSDTLVILKRHPLRAVAEAMGGIRARWENGDRENGDIIIEPAYETVEIGRGKTFRSALDATWAAIQAAGEVARAV
jgi:hypothetical protein